MNIARKLTGLMEMTMKSTAIKIRTAVGETNTIARNKGVRFVVGYFILFSTGICVTKMGMMINEIIAKVII